MTRRDKCYLIGKRAGLLRPAQASSAWANLAATIEGMGEMDLPKFNHLLKVIRAATIYGKSNS